MHPIQSRERAVHVSSCLELALKLAAKISVPIQAVAKSCRRAFYLVPSPSPAAGASVARRSGVGMRACRRVHRRREPRRFLPCPDDAPARRQLSPIRLGDASPPSRILDQQWRWIFLCCKRGAEKEVKCQGFMSGLQQQALAPAAAPATPITLVSSSHGLIPETELSDEDELQHSVVPIHQETVPQPLPLPARRTIVPRRVDEKGKDPEEAFKQICGICLSEDQRATLHGLLNCCSHHFCFTCILEWSKVESRCPLCKRRFNTITVADVGSGLRSTAIRVEKRDQVYHPNEEEMNPYENAICIECNRSGEDNLMLQCDICDSSAHTFCVGLGRELPEGNWYCGGCRSSVEGHSYAQIQDRVVHHAENNTNTADISSNSFGRSVSSGLSQRTPSLNIHQPSLQEFDLNLSPIETPNGDRRAVSHISPEPVSTSTGRQTALNRRRAMDRRIRRLLFRSSTATNVCQNGVQNFREAANAKVQLIPIVKKSIKHICAQSPLDQSAFMNVARRATNTILALSGVAHNSDRVVATPFHLPSHCGHACDGREPAFLMRSICSPCFKSFVGDVVGHIVNMYS